VKVETNAAGEDGLRICFGTGNREHGLCQHGLCQHSLCQHGLCPILRDIDMGRPGAILALWGFNFSGLCYHRIDVNPWIFVRSRDLGKYYIGRGFMPLFTGPLSSTVLQ